MAPDICPQSPLIAAKRETLRKQQIEIGCLEGDAHIQCSSHLLYSVVNRNADLFLSSFTMFQIAKIPSQMRIATICEEREFNIKE